MERLHPHSYYDEKKRFNGAFRRWFRHGESLMAITRRLTKKGFTLPEMLISVAVLGIIFGIFPVLFIQVTQLQRQTEARLGIQRDARLALDLIQRYLRQGQASTVVVDRYESQPFYSRIQFSAANGKSYIFYQNGTNLKMVVSGSTKTISDNLLYLAFTYSDTGDDNIISVSITTEKATYEGGAKNLQLSVEKVRIMND